MTVNRNTSVKLKDANETKDVNLPSGQVKSKVDKEESTASVIVDGMDALADGEAKDNAVVEVTFAIAEVDESKPGKEEIEKHAPGGHKLEFMDFTIHKTVFYETGSTDKGQITDTGDNAVAIMVPFEKHGKKDIKVYRYHGDKVDVLGQTPNSDGEWIEIFDDHIIIHAKKFSAYAIGYGETDLGENNKPPMPISIEGAEIIIAVPEPYTGQEIKPDVTVKSEGKTLVEGTDFTVAYGNNIYPGTATVTITGIGNYTGTITESFTITKADQTITGETEFNKAYGSKAFSLGASAVGKLTYKSSDSKIATVSSSGKTTIKNTGRATITISAAETETHNAAVKKVTISVSPKKVASLKAKSTKKKKATISWKKDKRATGYQIVYSTDKKFKKGVKKANISKNKTVKKTVSKLKSKKTYYVKVRAYKKVGSTKIYGTYSSVKKVKVK